MGAGREGYDLLTKYGRMYYWERVKSGRFPRVMWRDTFGRVICWLHGEHSIRQDFENGVPETSCTTCCKWLKQEGYKWVTK